MGFFPFRNVLRRMQLEQKQQQQQEQQQEEEGQLEDVAQPAKPGCFILGAMSVFRVCLFVHLCNFEW